MLHKYEHLSDRSVRITVNFKLNSIVQA